MNEKIIELLAILDEETACYSDMRRVLADEAATISLSRRDRFDQVQHEKQSLVDKLKQLEETRKTLVGQLSAATATDGRIMTVRQLAHCVTPPTREKLLARATRLRSIIDDVKEKNRHNQLMITCHLELIKGTLKLLTNLLEDSSVYHKPGSHQSAVGYPIGGGRFICGTT